MNDVEKYYVSLDRLSEYNTLIRTEIGNKDQDILTQAKSYTNTEFEKIQEATSAEMSEINEKLGMLDTISKNVDDLSDRIDEINVPTKTSQLTNDSNYATETYIQNYAQPKGEYLTSIPSEYITESELNDKGYLTQSSVNELSTKVNTNTENLGKMGGTIEVTSGLPTKDNTVVTINPNGSEVNIYTAEEVDALLSNVSGGVIEETDPTVPSWAKQPTKPSYTASEVGADVSGTATTKVSEHNVSNSAHSDIRDLISVLTTKVNHFLDVDDTTSDELSEVLALIKANKGTLESLTSGKINVSDIIDNLTTSDSTKVLSAKQGVQLKALIDAIKVPTKTSELTNDSGFLTQIPSEYVTETELNNKKYLTDIPSEYITETELNAKGYLTQHQSLSGYAKTADHYTKTESDNKYQAKGNYLTYVPSEYVTETELSAKGYLSSIPSEYVTDSELNAKGYLTQHQDLSSYAKKTEIPVEVAVQNSKPTEGSIWIDTDSTGEIILAEIDDDAISDEKTWSSKKISEIQEEIVDLKESGTDTISIPEYWKEHLKNRANVIQTAMEKAGRKKSAFLWYTDAHWINGNSKKSPILLDYLYRNSPMNKVNFGGDIIGDSLLATREDMKYIYEWRKAIKDLPNHHSVLGNHDMFESDSVDYEDDNYRYALLIAPEETSDMVIGDGNYYYIDNHAEKTRYLYICYPNTNVDWLLSHSQFIADAIMGVQEGWHIVAISHRWWQYSSSSKPTAGGMGAFEADILAVFDAYNARTTRNGSTYFKAQDFTNAKGKVEFCIGGHIHIDLDLKSDGGIPVIITTADTNQNRVPDSTVDSGTVGTTTESAVFGIIADYNDAENTKITVVGVGRGTSRVVDKNGSAVFYPDESGGTDIPDAPIPSVNLFDKNDSDIVDTGRFNSSNNVVTGVAGQLVTGFIEAKVGDVFTIKTDRALDSGSYSCDAMMYKSDKSVLDNLNNATTTWELSSDKLTGVFTLPATYPNWSVTFEETAFVRFSIAYTNIDNIDIRKA